MPLTTDTAELHDHEVVDRDGEKIGTIKEVYEDQVTGRPEWALVSGGLFGLRSHFVPLAGAEALDGHIQTAVTKDQVKDAPAMNSDGEELSEQEERRLFEHYGVPYTPSGSTTAQGAPTGRPDAGSAGRDLTGPNTDDAMTRSEEEVRVGTAERERGRARLRKYVVTENVTRTVPVRHEEVRVEREPITDANIDRAMDGPEISEEEHEVVLHEEEPVVEKRAVPKERVRLATESHQEEREVSEQVRKERIDMDGKPGA